MIDCIDAYLRAYFYMIPNDNLSDIGNNTIVIYKDVYKRQGLGSRKWKKKGGETLCLEVSGGF